MIDLSGIKLQLSIPFGNRYDIPDPAGKFMAKCNIYETPDESYLKDDETNLTIVLQRPYKYSGFLGEDLGGLQFNVGLWRTKNKQTNLFDMNKLEKHLNDYLTKTYSKWNKEADEAGQIFSPDEYNVVKINDVEFLHYNIGYAYGVKERSIYSTAITEDCHLDFSFVYISTIDDGEQWHKMAKMTENQIMESVKIELTNSANIAKNAAT